MKIEFEKTSTTEEYYNILVDDNIAGTFRLYYNIDIKWKNTKLKNFLGYINIKSNYRQYGIFTKVIKDFNIKSLCVDNIDDLSIETLVKIYKKLGFNFIKDSGEISKQFMIKE